MCLYSIQTSRRYFQLSFYTTISKRYFLMKISTVNCKQTMENIENINNRHTLWLVDCSLLIYLNVYKYKTFNKIVQKGHIFLGDNCLQFSGYQIVLKNLILLCSARHRCQDLQRKAFSKVSKIASFKKTLLQKFHSSFESASERFKSHLNQNI